MEVTRCQSSSVGMWCCRRNVSLEEKCQPIEGMGETKDEPSGAHGARARGFAVISRKSRLKAASGRRPNTRSFSYCVRSLFLALCLPANVFSSEFQRQRNTAGGRRGGNHQCWLRAACLLRRRLGLRPRNTASPTGRRRVPSLLLSLGYHRSCAVLSQDDAGTRVAAVHVTEVGECQRR